MIQCPKCGAKSGDEWPVCKGYCPMIEEAKRVMALVPPAPVPPENDFDFDFFDEVLA